MYELRTSAENAFDVTIAVSPEMQKAMELWKDMYKGNPPWKNRKDDCSGCDDLDGCTLQIPAAVASELARLVTLEMKVTVGESTPMASFLNTQIQESVKKARNATEIACALGGIILKPYVSGPSSIGTSVITPENFLPVDFSSDGDITAAIFPYVYQSGGSRYTRLEYHRLEPASDGFFDCYIQNKCFKQTSNVIESGKSDIIGSECDLSEVDVWADIEPETIIRNVRHTLFAYFKMPFANTVELLSPLGVSAYAKATEIIQKADEQLNRTVWEYEATEAAIYVPEDFLKIDENGNVEKMPKRDHRLYRKFDCNPKDISKLIEPYNPDIRCDPQFKAIDNYKREIEFLCGLAYGTLSNPQSVEKSATEVKQSMQRSYSTVGDIQKQLQNALNDLAVAMSHYAVLYKMAPQGNFKLSCDWDDGIVVDRSQQYAEMFGMVSAGMLKTETFLAWYFNTTEADARKYLPAEAPDEEGAFINEAEE